ncbi:methyltransferase small [Thermofilum pendens Hrk 5]|uniref:Methyltransferase small n=2 Tax=Thermofilum pendens TaxID=2269 RepID=A1RYG8_THEPD|nr:methyltransferase small [Thermofilum pendens Hrk 5]
MLLTFLLLMLRLYMRLHAQFARFLGLTLLVPPGCFTPIGTYSTWLVSRVLEASPSAEVAVEVGTGVGTLALLAAKRGAYAVGVEVSEPCLRAAKANARRNSLDGLLDFVLCDAGSCLRSSSAGLVFTNPPYLPVDSEKPEDVPVAGGSDLSIFKKMLVNAVRIAKPGAPVVYSASNLTGLSIGKILLCARTPIDEVCAYLVVRPRRR